MLLHPKMRHYWSVENDSLIDHITGNTADPKFCRFEMGSVSVSGTIDGDGTTVSVSFQNTYNDPIVVPYIPTRGGGQSIHAFVKDVTSTGCTIYMEEPDGGGHNTETVCYVVTERGLTFLPDASTQDHSIAVEAGTVSLSETGSTTVTFSSDFQSLVVAGEVTVLVGKQTRSNASFLYSRITNISDTDFSFRVEDGNTGETGTEEYSYIAFSMFGGRKLTQGGPDLRVETEPTDGSNDGVDDTAHALNYSGLSNANPPIVVSLANNNGNDYCWARGAGSNWTSSQHDVYAEEDQVNDTERGHADEPFSFIVIDAADDVYGTENFTAGKVGRAVQGGEGIVYATSEVLSGAAALGDYSIDCWFRQSALSGAITDIISADRSEFFVLGFNRGNSSDKLDWSTRGDTSGVHDLSSAGALDDGAWHHVLAVYEEATGDKFLYIDGALSNSAVGAHNDGEGLGNTGSSRRICLLTNVEGDNSIYPAVGEHWPVGLDVDELRVWNAALGLEDAKRLMLGMHPLSV